MVDAQARSQLQALAGCAREEAARSQRGRATEELIGLMWMRLGAPLPVFENLTSGADWEAWRIWVSRLEMAASNEAWESVTRLIDERPAAPAGSRGDVVERLGFDFAIRTSSPRGASTSPSAAPPDANTGTNVGTFRVFADNGLIVPGDGRAPKTKKKAR